MRVFHVGFISCLFLTLAAVAAGCSSGGPDSDDPGSNDFTTSDSTSKDSTSECVSFCVATGRCSGATASDCAALCTDNKSIVANAHCTSQYDHTLSCLSGVADVCAPHLCATQTSALDACVQPYCTSHPSSCGGRAMGGGEGP
jgi:hypothetical protein